MSGTWRALLLADCDVGAAPGAINPVRTVLLQPDPKGQATLGRETLGIQDKRVSRRQLQLHLSPDGTARCELLGVNHSQLQLADGTLSKLDVVGALVEVPAGAVVWLCKTAGRIVHPVCLRWQRQ